MNRKALVYGMSVFVWIGLVMAKDWWEDKPYLEWTKRDAKRMLDNSPWAKIHTVTIINPMHTGERNFSSIGSGDLQREKHNRFHIRLLTAKPIRMALARQTTLENKNTARSNFEGWIEQSDDQNIVLTMSLSSIPQGSDSIRVYWSTLLNLRTADLVADTFLATKSGKRAYLAHYEPPGEDRLGAKFYFVRNLPDGNPFLTLDDKEVRFETKLTLLRSIDGYEGKRFDTGPPGQFSSRTDRIRARFKLNKMNFQGQLEL